MRMELARRFSFHFLYTLLYHEVDGVDGVDGVAIDAFIVDMPMTGFVLFSCCLLLQQR